MSKGLGHLTHEEKLRVLGMFSSGGILPTCINTVKKMESYCIALKERMGGNGQKLKYSKFNLNIRKYFLAVRLNIRAGFLERLWSSYAWR